MAGTGSGGGVAGGLGADNAGGTPWAGPLELRRSVGGFLVDDQHAAEDEAKGVGDDGGAAGGDAALGHEDDEMGESGVDLLGRFESGDDFTEKIAGEVGAVGGGMRSSTYARGVTGAEAPYRILRPEAALGASAITGAASI